MVGPTIATALQAVAMVGPTILDGRADHYGRPDHP